MKRIFLFLATNLLVMATISIVFNLLGLQPYLTAQGINYTSLAIFCFMWGMGGAFISLFLSKFMAKRAMSVQIIDPNNTPAELREYVNMVRTLSERAGLPAVPEIGIYQSPEPNAFATGATKKSSLVAVSTGLLQQMSRDEVEGVIGHEISHIANGDMVTMTLLQGVINAFALFLARIIAFVISSALSRGEDDGISYITYFAVSFVLDILLTLLGSIVVCAFSRWREFHADKGGAKLAGRDKMISALQRLETLFENPDLEDKRGDALNTMKISHKARWMGLFTTHPPLSERIKRLQS